MSRILISILNYRTPELTLRCAESLRSELQQFPHAKLVIVDNGSGEVLAETLSALLCASETLASVRDRVQLLCLPANGGFAAGNNAVIRPALACAEPPDYVWLLNSDTLVRHRALEALVTAMESNPRLGIAGSRLENEDETPQRSAFRFPTIAGEWEANVQWSWLTRVLGHAVIALAPTTRDTRVDWVAGASMLIRCEVFRQIGLLDESFFMYFEDMDYCHRASDAGWETWYIPASRVEHQIGASSTLNSSRPNRNLMPPYWFAARRHYFRKYHGRLYPACADAAWLLSFGLWRVRQFVQGKPDTHALHFWRDFFAYSIGQRRHEE